ncbi:MAG TPA: hypothetical protein VHE55_17395 [Fimbriimonadaceae bacterium]|nr:hypothetical protein [Fimbriimonadaceae bacterium]
MIDRLDIHAFADRELSPEEMARLQHEIQASPDAARELEVIQSLKVCLAGKLEAPTDASLWRGCVGRLNEIDRARKAEQFVGKYAWAICGALFLAILGGGILNHYRGPSVGMGTIASEISSMTPMSSMPLSQPEQLRGSRIVIDPRKVIRAAYLDQPSGRTYRFRMNDAIGIVDVLLIPNVSGIDGVQEIGDGMSVGRANGLNCVTWQDGGGVVIVAGEQDPQQLRDFARSLYR